MLACVPRVAGCFLHKVLFESGNGAVIAMPVSGNGAVIAMPVFEVLDPMYVTITPKIATAEKGRAFCAFRRSVTFGTHINRM